MRSILTAMLLVLLAALTNVRVRVWQSDETLWADAAAKAPESPRAVLNALLTSRTVRGRTWTAINEMPEDKPRYEAVRQLARDRWPQAQAQWAWKMATTHLGRIAAVEGWQARAICYFSQVEDASGRVDCAGLR